MISISKITLRAAVVMAVAFFGTAAAQESNTIQEIRLSNQDGFNEVRNQLISNFDFTNPNLSEGTVNSEVAFTVEENGKLTNIHAKGDCKYVSEELESVMKNLLLKVNPEKLAGNSMATIYVLPVSVKINNR